jgi:hypothetical protein
LADLAAEEAEGLNDEVDAGAGFALVGGDLVFLDIAGDLDLVAFAGEEGFERGLPEDEIVPKGGGVLAAEKNRVNLVKPAETAKFVGGGDRGLVGYQALGGDVGGDQRVS